MCIVQVRVGLTCRGMHIEATWHGLSDGTWYMDQVTVSPLLKRLIQSVLPTFAIEVPEDEFPDQDPQVL